MSTGTRVLKIVSDIMRNRSAQFHEISGVYRPAIERQRDRWAEVIRDTAERTMKSELGKKARVAKEYFKLEMAPPRGNELQQLWADVSLMKEFFLSGAYKFLTVRQAWLLFLVGLEVTLWFYLGETVGKMHIVGYTVSSILNL